MSAADIPNEPLSCVTIADGIGDVRCLVEAADMAVLHLGAGHDDGERVEAISIQLRVIKDKLEALAKDVMEYRRAERERSDRP